MTAAIHYDGGRDDAGRPVGMDVAFDQFLRAFIHFGAGETLYCACPDQRAFEDFTRRVVADGGAPDRWTAVTGEAFDGRLGDVGCLMRFDPAIAEAAWPRRRLGQRRYSLCGIAHASSTPRVMDLAGAYLAAPMQEWDALICPSRSIRSAILAALASWRDYYESRFGACAACAMEFPVIPLGVDAARFAAITGGDERARQRGALGLGADDVMLLYVGRLSHFAKANPLPLLVAAEEAAKRAAKTLHLVFFGYFADAETETAFEEAARAVTRACKTRFVLHGDPAFPDGPWAAADVFCSLSDNIQESFGLTPLEAMAAGLPSVVSDWDGYRETVRDGLDGYRISTVMPAEGAGADLAFRLDAGLDSYGAYLAGAAQATSVDLAALADALVRLADDAELRLRLGASARTRARETFDWPRVIAAYEELWTHLADKRAKAPESAPRAATAPVHPGRPDPFAMFADFASVAIEGAGRIEMALDDWDAALQRIALKVSLYNPDALIDLEDVALLVGQIEAERNATVDEIANRLAHLDARRLRRTLGWLIKLGICRYLPPEAG